MRLKWFGTATVLLEENGEQLLFDPFFSLNANGFAPPMDEFSAIGSIFVTHGHLDHIIGIPEILKNVSATPTVYCTTTPKEVLVSKGVEESLIHTVAPGDIMDIGPFSVSVLKGKHIVFNKWLLVKKLISLRNLIYLGKLTHLVRENKVCIEAGETVVYEISASGKRILLLGSLNLDEDTQYPDGVDLLILPLQGRSNISRYALPFIGRVKPKCVFLVHFDDSFPPISSSVETGSFVKLMQKSYPNVRVICPQASTEWIPWV